MRQTFYDDDHEAFREVVATYIAHSVAPSYPQWEADRLIDRAAWTDAGAAGLLGMAAQEAFGGADVDDYRFRCVIAEELAFAGATSLASGFALQDDIVIPYLLEHATKDQLERWMPSLVSGETISAIAMTEPGTGSDLRGITTSAVRDGSDWVLSGQKTFITNGIHADLVIVVARTDTGSGPRHTLFVVEREAPGFERGRKIDKIGLHAQDTAELFFDQVRVPAENVLGEVGAAFGYLMAGLPRERLSIAVAALAGSAAALRWTEDYVFQRTAFGTRVGDFQNTRFMLAEMETELDVTRAYVHAAVLAQNEGSLTTGDASKAKWWTTELQERIVTRGLQLFGGYGFTEEFPIGRAFRDSRVQSIYGGTTEIMKEIIGREIERRHR
ncbi:long-chain-acyl-CoA dehydrogenase [Microbacterium terrae]|uniref:Acyl-[acyl-carrier-protein] dehydrogenase MbtN n=1 Tax=Microbacterium terrae TaxID=69369 RepID=A0A0M2GVH8_9MICO|nr:acyl-CoA dehydrogenase family protein [Microbacterium terrae]KJL37507.1 Acyl-CoA dehydrogenase [Microbacterium terrae]MBP1076336.1 long-chain-acyl-CoA dehydrogenase [Microbacterium terrae]GLJ97160.1 acyl-CoA dehydrogenase [Microbacterium terrae]